jgi:hypothetical protein
MYQLILKRASASRPSGEGRTRTMTSSPTARSSVAYMKTPAGLALVMVGHRHRAGVRRDAVSAGRFLRPDAMVSISRSCNLARPSRLALWAPTA